MRWGAAGRRRGGTLPYEPLPWRSRGLNARRARTRSLSRLQEFLTPQTEGLEERGLGLPDIRLAIHIDQGAGIGINVVLDDPCRLPVRQLDGRKAIAPQNVGAFVVPQAVLMRERGQVIGQDTNGLFIAG